MKKHICFAMVASLIPLMAQANLVCSQTLMDGPQLGVPKVRLPLLPEALAYLKLAQEAQKIDASPEAVRNYNEKTYQLIQELLRTTTADVVDLLEFSITKIEKTFTVDNKAGEPTFVTPVTILDPLTHKNVNVQIVIARGMPAQLHLIFDRMTFIKDKNAYLEFKSGTAIDKKTGEVTPHHPVGFIAKKLLLQLPALTLDRMAWGMQQSKIYQNKIYQLMGFYSMAFESGGLTSPPRGQQVEAVLNYTGKIMTNRFEETPMNLLVAGLALKPEARDIFIKAIEIENKMLDTGKHKSTLDSLVQTMRFEADRQALDVLNKKQLEAFIQVCQSPDKGEGMNGLPHELRVQILRILGSTEPSDTWSYVSKFTSKGEKLFEKVIEDLLDVGNPVINKNGDIDFKM